MNIPSIVRLNHFGFFPCSQLSIREEITLLIYLDPLDCIDVKVFKVSWFLGLFLSCFARHSKWLLFWGFLSDAIWNGSLSRFFASKFNNILKFKFNFFLFCFFFGFSASMKLWTSFLMIHWKWPSIHFSGSGDSSAEARSCSTISSCALLCLIRDSCLFTSFKESWPLLSPQRFGGLPSMWLLLVLTIHFLKK